MLRLLSSAVAAALACLTVPAIAAGPDVGELYKEHCSECHGLDRLGRQGPALLPQNLVSQTLKDVESRIIGIIDCDPMIEHSGHPMIRSRSGEHRCQPAR